MTTHDDLIKTIKQAEQNIATNKSLMEQYVNEVRQNNILIQQSKQQLRVINKDKVEYLIKDHDAWAELTNHIKSLGISTIRANGYMPINEDYSNTEQVLYISYKKESTVTADEISFLEKWFEISELKIVSIGLSDLCSHRDYKLKLVDEEFTVFDDRDHFKAVAWRGTSVKDALEFISKNLYYSVFYNEDEDDD